MMRVVALVLLVLATLSSGRADAAVLYLQGYENGTSVDGTNIYIIGSISSGSSPDGNYHHVINTSPTPAASITFGSGVVNTCAWGLRFLYSMSGGFSNTHYMMHFNGGTALGLYITAAEQLQVQGSDITTTTGSTALSTSTWYTIRVAYDCASSGVVRVWVNDTLEIDTTHSGSTANLTSFGPMPVDSDLDSVNTSFDSYVVYSTASTPPLGRVIARTGTQATPTYNDGAVTCASCTGSDCESCSTGTTCCAWSDKDGVGSTSVLIDSSETSSMHVCDFSKSTCPASGDEVISGSDTVNGCFTMARALRGGGSPPSNCTGGSSPYCFVTRLNGSDTITDVSLGTSAGYYRSPVWIPGANSYLDSMEVGMRKGSGAARDITAHMMWVYCDYTLYVAPPSGRRRGFISHSWLKDWLRGLFSPGQAYAGFVGGGAPGRMRNR